MWGRSDSAFGTTQDAVPWHRQAVQMKPDYAQFRYLLGLVLLRTNQPEEAVAEFREAARLLPECCGVPK